METLLNVLWLAVALALIGLWRFRWFSSRRNPRAGVLPEIVAIGCAISLLLPAISLTDDLHPEIVAVDTASGKRNSCLLLVGAMSARHVTPLSGAQSIFAVLRDPFANTEFKISGMVPPTQELHSLTPCGRHLGRSPPSLQ
jgi:hypothetical protein